MKELTKAEEQVMQYLWEIKKGFLKDVVEQFPDPRPASTTVSTVIRVLEKKGFIAHNTYGKVNEYYPLVQKQDYFKSHFKGMVKSFFNGSVTNFASFFTNNEDVDLTELEEIKKMIDGKIAQMKEDGK